MSKPERFLFGVRIETHDETGELLAVYISIRKGKVATTREHAGGNLIADYDKDGKLLGIEMIGPCQVAVLDKIAVQANVRRFVRSAVPRGMIRRAA